MAWNNKIKHIGDLIPIPTPRTLWLVALGMASALIWGWKGMLFPDMAIVLLCILDYSLILRDGPIECKRQCPSNLHQGVPEQSEILLRNKGASHRHIQVRDQTPGGWEAAPVLKGTVHGRSHLSFKYRVTPPERGHYRFGDIFLRIEGPLGLVRRSLRADAAEAVKVFPRLQPLRYPDLATYRRMARHWGLRPARWRGEGREFEALREYIEGDDPRKIHWKASARLDRPIVQEYQPEKNQIVVTLLDSGRLMGAFSEGKSKLDHALDAAVQLSHTVLTGGDQAGILTFADQVISFVPPKRTHNQLQSILEGTLSLQPSMVEPQYEEAFLWLRSRVRRRSLVVIFTDLLDETASENLLEAVSLLRPLHLPLCVTIRESEWEALLGRTPSNAQEVYELAVLQDSLRQRDKAMRGLIQKGALVLDLPPERLSLGTLERYLEVKGRGLL